VSWETILATLGVKRLGEILVPFGIRLCEPTLIKREAEAHVAALRLLTNEISEAEEVLPKGTMIEYNNKEGLRLSTTTDPETLALRQRSLTRNVAKELIAQYCLEGVVAAAAEEAAKLTSVPDEKPDTTWALRFLGYAEGMADPYLQELWGKVLTGEIKQPGSYSLRTLDVLSAMTQKEAQRFVAACQYLVWTPHYPCIPRDVTFLRGSDLTLRDFAELAEIGLFQETEVSMDPFGVGATEYYFGFSDAALAVTKGPTPTNTVWLNPCLSIWLLTKSGRELTKFFPWETPSGYVENFRDGIQKIAWESRIGKIADYSNPKFEENKRDREG
jgi:hypothetical protein